VLGIPALLDGGQEEYTAQARGFVEALWFNGTTMRQLIKEDHALAMNLRNLLAEHASKTIDDPMTG
jgi:CRP-like cAMP-binding protein